MKSTERPKSHATLGATCKSLLAGAAFGAYRHPQRASTNVLTASVLTVLGFSSVFLREGRT